MKRFYESGAQKRKKLKIREEILKNQQNSIKQFVVVKNREESQNDCNDPCIVTTEESNADITPTSLVSSDHVIEDNAFDFTQEDNTNNGTTTATALSGTTDTTKHQTYSKDIALWPKPITNDFIEFCIREKPRNIGNIKNSKIDFDERGKIVARKLSESHFYLTKANGTQERREWLIFSETTKSVYCFICKLFSKKLNVLVTGCSDWKNIGDILRRHDEAKEHKECMCMYVKRSKSVGRIDSEMIKACEKQTNYWREVLKRVVATVKLLAKLGL